MQDAMCVARNVALDPKLVPGGGAVEMAVAAALTEKSKSISGVHQWPYRAVAQALEVPVPCALRRARAGSPDASGRCRAWGSAGGAHGEGSVGRLRGQSS